MKKTTYLFLAYLWATLAVIQAQDKTKELFEELLQNTSSLEVVKELVKAGANPQATFQKEGSWAYMMKPLHIAAASQNLELVKYFVSKGANIHEFVKYPASFTANTQTHNNCNALAISAHYHVGKPEGEAMINYLLAQGADINGYVCGGQTIIMYALMSENTNEKTIQFLIDKGANLNKLRKEDMSNGWKESVFLYAFDSYKKKVKMKEIKLMVARGAKTVGDFVTWSFLNHCIFYGKNELAKYLLEQKLVSITDQGSEEEYGSNMNIAAGVGNLEMIDYMLKLGVKPETKAANGKNALDLAREKNQEKALKLLLTKKIEPADKAYMDLRNDPAYERVIFHNKKAENFSLPTPQGKTITFADYKGKVVLLNIWATWCLPCVLEMPNIHKLQTAIRQPNFKVVAVAIDAPDRKKNILDFLKENPSYKFDYAIDQNYEKMVYGYATTIPGTFLIDKNGNIVAEVKGKVDWSTEPYIKLIKTILAL